MPRPYNPLPKVSWNCIEETHLDRTIVRGTHRFVWDAVEVDLFNLSGDPTSPSLFGALTQAPGPSWLAGVDYGGALWMDTLALAIIAAGAWLWLRARRVFGEK